MLSILQGGLRRSLGIYEVNGISEGSQEYREKGKEEVVETYFPLSSPLYTSA